MGIACNRTFPLELLLMGVAFAGGLGQFMHFANVNSASTIIPCYLLVADLSRTKVNLVLYVEGLEV
jgi:hypothetical protein